MKTIKSEVKLDREGFNNQPGELERSAYYKRNKISLFPYDIEGIEYWQNAGDTLVVKVSGEKECLQLGKMALEMNADEMQFNKINGELFVRIWWD